MDSKVFERCLVNFVAKLAEEKFSSKEAFAEKVFFDTNSPGKAWQYVRIGQKGKLQPVSVEEAFNMAKALDMGIDVLCWKVFRAIEDGWTLEDDMFTAPDHKPGRPSKRQH